MSIQLRIKARKELLAWWAGWVRRAIVNSPERSLLQVVPMIEDENEAVEAEQEPVWRWTVAGWVWEMVA
jgi:hypothetical protein